MQTIPSVDRSHGLFAKTLTIYSLVSFGSVVVWHSLLALRNTQTDHILVVRSGHRVSILLLSLISIILHLTTRIYLLRHVLIYVIFKW